MTVSQDEAEADPILVARTLTASLQKNTAALLSIKRRYRVVIAGLVLLLLTFSVAVTNRHYSAVSDCHRGNELRGQINQKFTEVGVFLKENGPSDPTLNSLVMLLVTPLPPRDCGSIGWP